jgi:hypothetical protein
MLLAGGCSTVPPEGLSPAIGRYQRAHAPLLAANPQPIDQRKAVTSDTVEDQLGWLAYAKQDAKQDEPAESIEPADQTEPLHWSKRYGPAYPDNILRSFAHDIVEFPATYWDDSKATVMNPFSVAAIGMAGAAGIVINASGSDNRVADHFTKRGSQLNTFWDSVGDVGGQPGVHFAVAGAWYFAALAANDNEHYETAKTMLHALALNQVVTVGLKVIVRARSPNGDPWGWPSGHTSSSFCFATVMCEEYGPWVGLPLFAFAAYVGYERIDARNHDFSDVVSGALIGVAIGHAVSRNHRMRIFDMDVIPYTSPTSGGFGLALHKEW